MLLRLLRHPATAPSGERCIGQTDVALSAEGLAAIERIAEDAARTKPARILSSDLRRCRTLADAIAARLDICPEPDAIWREVNFGAWENRTWDEIRSDDPHTLAEWMEHFVTVAPPGGESFHQLQSRVVSALQKIDPEPFDSLLVVTHAGVIRAAVCAFSDLPLRRAFELEVSCGSTTCLRWKDDDWSVVPNALLEAEVRP
jgi:alpha-ribazole phosphatase